MGWTGWPVQPCGPREHIAPAQMTGRGNRGLLGVQQTSALPPVGPRGGAPLQLGIPVLSQPRGGASAQARGGTKKPKNALFFPSIGAHTQSLFISFSREL